MRVAVGNGEIDVIDTGDGGTAKPVLVMLHAFALAKEIWDTQAAALADRARIVRLDLRGMGRSSVTPGPYPIDLLARDVINVAAALHLKPFILVGHSYSCSVSLEVHRQARDRLAGLALVGGTGEAPNVQTTERMLDDADAIEEQGMQAVVGPRGASYLGKTTHRNHPEVWQRVRTILLATDKHGAAATLSGMAMRTALTDEYRRIGVPTRVLAGNEDALQSIDTLRAMTSRIPGAVLDELPGGHVPSLEAPDSTTNALASLVAAIR